MLQPVFDAEFYHRQNGLTDQDALIHYLLIGDRTNRDPGPYFATAFYKRRYPDWRQSGARTAAEDFLRRTHAGQMRQPHPLIAPAEYAARHPDLARLGAQAALHFMTHGDAEGRSPSDAFDAAF